MVIGEGTLKHNSVFACALQSFQCLGSKEIYIVEHLKGVSHACITVNTQPVVCGLVVLTTVPGAVVRLYLCSLLLSCEVP